ncbi:MAG: enoyl-CoA hydratase/isomerase family protein [Deferribacteres bacterium]|nr:enoyl-CoA hydratase/isomerase family protein [Deferribacteres bacterium]
MKTIKLEKEGRIAWLTLNRPDKLNAMNVELAVDLYNAVYEVENDRDVRVLVIRGEGKAFCAGGDLMSFVESPDLKKTITDILTYLNSAVFSIRRMDKVVITAVHGFAAGAGFALAMCSDITVAAKGTKFNLAYAKIGASPDMGSSLFLTRLVGFKRASYYMLTGDFIDAEQALDWGLVNFVVDGDRLMEEVKSLAEKMASLAPLAVKQDKYLINRELFWDMETILEEEKIGIANLATTEDMKEGIKAFFEKRPPNFRGK